MVTVLLAVKVVSALAVYGRTKSRRTNAVVANCVVLVFAAAVGPAGTPVNVGDAKLALRLSAVVTKAVVASLVVLLPAVCVGAVGVPVKAGETSKSARTASSPSLAY